MSQMPARDWDEIVDRAAWSLLCGIMAAFLLLPLFASIARGDELIIAGALMGGGGDVPPEEVAFDLVGLAVSATVLALATEWLRTLVPAWRRGGEMGELAKTGLRIVPVLLGVAAAFAGWAPPIGDGSQPEMFGGVGAGLVASLFGGSLVTAVRDRLPGSRRRAAIVTPDGSETPLAQMTTGQFKAHRDEAAP